MHQPASSFPLKWPWMFIVGMSLGTLLATTLMHGFPSSREAWSDFGARVLIIVLVAGVFELIRWRFRRNAGRVPETPTT